MRRIVRDIRSRSGATGEQIKSVFFFFLYVYTSLHVRVWTAGSPISVIHCVFKTHLVRWRYNLFLFRFLVFSGPHGVIIIGNRKTGYFELHGHGPRTEIRRREKKKTKINESNIQTNLPDLSCSAAGEELVS